MKAGVAKGGDGLVRRAAGYLSLYGAHLLKLFSFVILLPHFTAVFSRDTWGLVLTVQGFSLWLQLMIEYGFNLSATRSMSVARDNAGRVAELVAGVIGAKMLLSIASVLMAVVGFVAAPPLRQHPELLLWATVYAVVQGFNPIWYFLARERFARFAAIDFTTRLTYLLLCLFLIRSEQGAPLVFAFGVLSGLIASVAGYITAFREVGYVRLSWPSTVGALKDGLSMFVFVAVTSLYTSVNLFVLGLFTVPATVAVYGNADRIVRAAGGLLDPINRVVYARVTYLFHHDLPSALAYLRKAGALIVGVALVIFVAGMLLAPWGVRWLFGPAYSQSAYYMRLLLAFVPVLALNNILGLQVMLPLGMDRAFNTVFIGVSVLSLVLMLVTLPLYGATAMAVITVLTEVLACLGMAWCIVTSRRLRTAQVQA